MKPRDRKIALFIALPGLACCLFFVASFMVTMWANELAWNERPFFQEHYLAVGKAYSEAFAVGFFFCFFLMTGAFALARSAKTRKSAVPAAGTAPSPS